MTETTRPDRAPAARFAPSARVVMIGAGQLARMTHQAAIDYGISLHVLAHVADDPAVSGGAAYTLGSFERLDDLAAVATRGEVITFDHELVPQAHLHALERDQHVLRPSARALAFAQDKLYARRHLGHLEGLDTLMPAFAPASTVADVCAFAATHSWPVVLKARGGGYDGRGVHLLSSPAAASRLLPDKTDASEPAWLVEEYLQLAGEFAILVARRPSGALVSYPPVGTFQTDGMCRRVIVKVAA